MLKYRALIIAVILLFTIKLHSQDTTYYEGVLEIDAVNKLRLSLDIIETKDTTLLFLTSIDQSTQKIPATKLKITTDSLKFNISNLFVKVRGAYSKDRSQIQCIFKQNLLTRHIVFNRVNTAYQFNRPQEPKEPFAYKTKELTFTSANTDYIFRGTLTYPDKKGKFPAVVLCSGSGLQDRDEQIFNHKPFKLIADYLTKNDIIVFRYDDRGFGAEDTSLCRGTTLDFALDAQEAINVLRTLPIVDTNHIGIIGHSEGGLIAQIIAKQDTNIDFIVLMASPAIKGKDVIISQTQAMLQYNNVANIDPIIDQLQNPIFDTNNMSDYWLKTFYYLDPKEYLPYLNCKVLVLQGQKDMQVLAKDNMDYMYKYLKNRAQYKIYPNLNHMFQYCKTGMPAEYITIEQTMSIEVLNDIVDFIDNIVVK